jgi:hypothetical protein
MRHEWPAGPWEEFATVVISAVTSIEQPRGKELKYRFVTVNKAGDAELSNIIMIVL